jgi:predicted nucleic acid-binding protein
MVVISDTGPLISLACIDRLDLLERLYGDVLIPEAVLREILSYSEIGEFPALVVFAKTHTKPISGVNRYTGTMHAGEAEAAALYRELSAAALIIDDRDARIIAEADGIDCFGTLAVLIDALNAGLLNCLRPQFITLLAHDRYYSKRLLNRILTEYGEDSIA